MERLPGFRDFYPSPVPHGDVWSIDLRNHIFSVWRQKAALYGFREYDGPPLEPLELYTAKSGPEIVGQLYNFVDKGERHVAMRPEMTPTLARMVAAHERAYKKPIKWFAIPQLFRYERQQKGRLREHFQFNADIFGETDPSADAELIALLIDTLRGLGLSSDDFVVRLSSREAWKRFYAASNADPAREHDFFQIIDKLERENESISEAKLQTLGIRFDQVKQFIEAAVPTEDLRAIQENLTARGLGDFVRIDYMVIRGLAYYTGPVFEAFDKKGEFRAIAGGGRYDHLVKMLTGGKVQLPGLGFGMGDVVLAELLKSRGLTSFPVPSPSVFLIVEEETLRPLSLKLAQVLRDCGHSLEFPLTPTKPDKQFKRAAELGSTWALRLELTDQNENKVWLKNLKTRDEKRLTLADAIDACRRGYLLRPESCSSETHTPERTAHTSTSQPTAKLGNTP